MRDFHLQFCFRCSITTALIIKDKSSKFVASNMEPGLSEEDVEQQKDTNLVITLPAKKPYNVLLKRRIAKLHHKMDMLTGVKQQ